MAKRGSVAMDWNMHRRVISKGVVSTYICYCKLRLRRNSAGCHVVLSDINYFETTPMQHTHINQQLSLSLYIYICIYIYIYTHTHTCRSSPEMERGDGPPAGSRRPRAAPTSASYCTLQSHTQFIVLYIVYCIIHNLLYYIYMYSITYHVIIYYTL